MSASVAQDAHGDVVLFSDEEVDAFIVAMLDGEDSVSIEDIERFVEWAAQMRIANAVIDLVIGGLVAVSLNDYGEPLFRQMANDSVEVAR